MEEDAARAVSEAAIDELPRWKKVGTGKWVQTEIDTSEGEMRVLAEQLKSRIKDMRAENMRALLLALCDTDVEALSKLVKPSRVQICQKCGELFDLTLGPLGCHLGACCRQRVKAQELKCMGCSRIHHTSKTQQIFNRYAKREANSTKELEVSEKWHNRFIR